MMMSNDAYEDMLWMEQIRAQRMRNRMMQMQWAQMGYGPHVRVIDRYDTYVEPYFGGRRTVYTRQYIQQRQPIRCHKRICRHS